MVFQKLDHDMVILWSGGLDSTGLLFLLLKESNDNRIHPIFVKHGQKNSEFEELAVKKYSEIFVNMFGSGFSDPFIITSDIPAKEFKTINSKTRHYLRNSDLINNAVRYALFKNISTVVLATFEDDFVDGSKEYLEVKNEEINKGTDSHFNLFSPFLEGDFYCHSKTELISLCKSGGLDLNQTRSCYENNVFPCKVCTGCKRRDAAFANVDNIFGH